MKPQAEEKGPGRECARGWHSPNGLQAPLDGFRGDEASRSIVDLVGQAEAHLQPAVDVQPHHARRTQAADSRLHFCRCHHPFTPQLLPRHTHHTNPPEGTSSPYTAHVGRRKYKWRPPKAREHLSRPQRVEERKMVYFWLDLDSVVQSECEGTGKPVFSLRGSMQLMRGVLSHASSSITGGRQAGQGPSPKRSSRQQRKGGVSGPTGHPVGEEHRVPTSLQMPAAPQVHHSNCQNQPR